MTVTKASRRPCCGGANAMHRTASADTRACARSTAWSPEARRAAASRNCQFLANFRQNFARFRLYRRRSLQENTRFAAFFKIYKIRFRNL